MTWSRRREEATPRMEQRHLRDERGRLWVGNVGSGTVRGGEEHAEVTFICRDQPGELKRLARLDVGPGQADDRWRNMDEQELLDTFHRSKPA
jgi:hypothetical protein